MSITIPKIVTQINYIFASDQQWKHDEINVISISFIKTLISTFLIITFSSQSSNYTCVLMRLDTIRNLIHSKEKNPRLNCRKLNPQPFRLEIKYADHSINEAIIIMMMLHHTEILLSQSTRQE